MHFLDPILQAVIAGCGKRVCRRELEPTAHSLVGREPDEILLYRRGALEVRPLVGNLDSVVKDYKQIFFNLLRGRMPFEKSDWLWPTVAKADPYAHFFCSLEGAGIHRQLD